MLAIPPLSAPDPLTGETPVDYDYAYDSYGRPSSLTRGNGRETAYSYDSVSRVSRLNHQGLVYTDFTYNPASQVRTRLLSSTLFAWDGDANVNRNYQVNPLNQYTNVGGVSHAYDLTGNLDDDGPDAYAYDPENRLKWSTRDEGQPGSVTVQLRYDGRGRLRRRHDGGFGTTEYVYAGDAMIAEMSGSTVLRRYIHGPGVDDPLIWYEGAGTSDRRYLHADERGSIVAVTDNAGGVIARNIYDEWGNPGSGNLGRFQYTGQQWLPELGLYYYKARFYNPRLGRFMQTDPIGYEDGMNLYAYVGNDPMNAADSLGTCQSGTHVEGVNAIQCRSEIDYEQARGLADDRRRRSEGASGVAQTSNNNMLNSILGCESAMTCQMSRDDRSVLSGDMSEEEYMDRAGARAAGIAAGLIGIGVIATRGRAAESIAIGLNAPGTRHALRHVIARGLNARVTQRAILRDARSVVGQLRPGETLTRTIRTQGRSLDYRIHRLADGRINIGSIRPPR